MAGIGFELKKLFNQKGYLHSVRAYLYTAFITIGPTVLCVTMVSALQLLLLFSGIGFKERELFLAAVTYSFIFSLILTSGFSMVVTRYISDKIFNKEYDDILPSLYGVISVCLLLGGISGIVFYFISPLNISFKLSAYILFMELIVTWLLSVYLSAIRDYMMIVKVFLLGVAITILCSYVFIKFLNFDGALSCIIAMNLGVFLIITFLLSYLRNFFKSKNKGYLRFMEYFDKYISLFFVGLFYTAGIYVHNFIFWGSSFQATAGDTYIFCPFYDVPSFYALLTIITAMVIFVVTVETSFYTKYRDYYSAVLGSGTLEDISRAKEEMKKVLFQEITYVMELQLFFTILFMVLGMRLLPKIGLIGTGVDIFSILALGSYCCIIMFIIMLVLLYFDDRRGALVISASFFLSNLTFTVITLALGENYYGFGFFASTFLTLIIAIIRLMVFLRDIDYYTFCSQPIILIKKDKFFSKLAKNLEAMIQ